MYITLNDNKIYYEVHGNKNGETIFFIHGAPGISDCRSDIQSFSSLTDEFQLVFMDMRGSGRSEGKRPFTHEQWTADIEALREHLMGEEKVHMLGGSYGGFLTLEYALRYGNHLKRIVLRDTAANSDFNQLSIDRALESNLPGINEERILRLFHGEVHSDEELKEMFWSIMPLYTVEFDEQKAKERLESIYFHFETHNDAFRYNKPKYDIVNQLPTIKNDTLVTVGRHDWVTPVICSETIHANLPHSRFVIFENSGHSPHAEEAETYLPMMRKFLQEGIS
ncbi:alpha/beta fold hydrolase [Salipaludibacillus daqingensis]|uniref:alpha/beta fold hydrolase n=1 Tax=Salipaludibacillus daqingensis TaxID=3041001 RepID=UPI002476B4DF|nr:alpha/beta fold hydrolase [Salipaludibacillus daqingensis]